MRERGATSRRRPRDHPQPPGARTSVPPRSRAAPFWWRTRSRRWTRRGWTPARPGPRPRAGRPTSHATIIARSFGLPAVVGIAGVCEAVSPEKPIVVDGDRGTVETNPSKERLRRSLLRVREGRDRARRQRARTSRAAATRDGVRIVVRANLELAEEIGALDRYHAEGVGLFRSEFLYLRAAPRFSRRRRAARGLREPSRSRGSAPRRRSHVRPRRRERHRSGARRESGARPSRPPLLPRAPRALRRAARSAVPGVAPRSRSRSSFRW